MKYSLKRRMYGMFFINGMIKVHATVNHLKRTICNRLKLPSVTLQAIFLRLNPANLKSSTHKS